MAGEQTSTYEFRDKFLEIRPLLGSDAATAKFFQLSASVETPIIFDRRVTTSRIQVHNHLVVPYRLRKSRRRASDNIALIHIRPRIDQDAGGFQIVPPHSMEEKCFAERGHDDAIGIKAVFQGRFQEGFVLGRAYKLNNRVHPLALLRSLGIDHLRHEVGVVRQQHLESRNASLENSPGEHADPFAAKPIDIATQPDGFSDSIRIALLDRIREAALNGVCEEAADGNRLGSLDKTIRATAETCHGRQGQRERAEQRHATRER